MIVAMENCSFPRTLTTKKKGPMNHHFMNCVAIMFVETCCERWWNYQMTQTLDGHLFLVSGTIALLTRSWKEATVRSWLERDFSQLATSIANKIFIDLNTKICLNFHLHNLLAHSIKIENRREKEAAKMLLSIAADGEEIKNAHSARRLECYFIEFICKSASYTLAPGPARPTYVAVVVGASEATRAKWILKTSRRATKCCCLLLRMLFGRE